jgi:hypothetical protein
MATGFEKKIKRYQYSNFICTSLLMSSISKDDCLHRSQQAKTDSPTKIIPAIQTHPDIAPLKIIFYRNLAQHQNSHLNHILHHSNPRHGTVTHLHREIQTRNQQIGHQKQ